MRGRRGVQPLVASRLQARDPEPRPAAQALGAVHRVRRRAVLEVQGGSVAVFKFKLVGRRSPMLVSVARLRAALGLAVRRRASSCSSSSTSWATCSRRGARAARSAPMFIPFLGALITLKSCPTTCGARHGRARRPDRRHASALRRVWAIGAATNRDFFRARVRGLLPQPLQPRADRRRSTAAARSQRSPGILARRPRAASSALMVVAPNPILILILIIGGMELWQSVAATAAPPRRRRTTRSRAAQRIAVGVVYLGLVGASHPRRCARPTSSATSNDSDGRHAHPRADARGPRDRRRR